MSDIGVDEAKPESNRPLGYVQTHTDVLQINISHQEVVLMRMLSLPRPLLKY